MALTVREHQALRLAGQRFRPGALETATRHQLGMSETRFWQVVNNLLEREDALAAHPMIVRRLRSLRDQRRAARAS